MFGMVILDETIGGLWIQSILGGEARNPHKEVAGDLVNLEPWCTAAVSTYPYQ